MGITNEDIKLAKEVQKKYNVPASLVLATYGVESGYGTSELARQNNNYFGMRNGSDGWQKFDSKKDSFMAYGELMSSDLYTSKSSTATNIVEYVKAIAETYAPSSDGNNGYANLVLEVIDDFELTKYDTVFDGKSTSTETPTNTQELVWWGDVVKVVFIIAVIVGGVVLLGIAVTDNKIGSGIAKKVKKTKEVVNK